MFVYNFDSGINFAKKIFVITFFADSKQNRKNLQI